MRLLLLYILSLFTACGRPDGSPDPVPQSHSLPADLEQKQQIYRELAPSRQNSNGFIETDHCDSLLLTSLLGAAGVPIADIHAAEQEPGKWQRRDLASGLCFPDGGSKSSISRDMLLGLMWYAWSQRDLTILEELYQYGEAHDWVMGEGDVARTGLRTLRGTLAAAIHKLGGPHRPAAELITDPQLVAKSGYEAHLQILGMLLRGEIYGELPQRQLVIIGQLASSNPDSPIMQAAAARWVGGKYVGKYTAAARNSTYFPNDRLATSADRCIDWATQQKNPADWAPCAEEGRVHSGGDWLFAAYVFQLPVPN